MCVAVRELRVWREEAEKCIVAHFDALQPAFSTFKEEKMKFTADNPSRRVKECKINFAC